MKPGEALAEQAWREFGERLTAYAAARLPDPDEAQDLVQEVFLRLHQSAPDSAAAVKSWLYTAIRNLIADRYRRRGKEAAPLDEEPPEAEPAAVSEQEMIVTGWLRPFMDEMPSHYRDALEMADLEGRSMKEVASALDLSLSGAKSRVQRARRMLHKRLTECCEIHFDAMGRVAGWSRRSCSDQAK